jgi:hypothetical protein
MSRVFFPKKRLHPLTFCFEGKSRDKEKRLAIVDWWYFDGNPSKPT